MKKILSSILAAATIASVAVFPASAEGRSNVSVDVPYMTAKPTFDGIINAEEWGEKTFTVTGSSAAKPGDTAPAANNTFAWYSFEYDTTDKVITSEDEEAKATVLATSYDVWLRWDLEYLYVAVQVNDPDGYHLEKYNENIWDGDCVQLRVDPMGPNSYQSYKNPDYDYTEEPFDVSAASVVGGTPWAYWTKICNVGLGMREKPVPVDEDHPDGIAIEYQAFDMANNGTGNLTEKMKINDYEKLGPDSSTGGLGVNLASEFYMTVVDDGNGGSVNSYELAMPWAFIDQWNLGQVAVGYAWGMSLVVLGASEESGKYHSWLTWGSGICGDQQEVDILKPTCGGSNAIILTDKDALDPSKTVADLPQASDDSVVTEKVPMVIDATGRAAFYLGSTEELVAVDGDYSASVDIAYLGPDSLKPDGTHIAFKLGDNYGMLAGWEASTKEFFIAGSKFLDGIDKDIPYAKSDETFDWEIGEWHNLGVTVLDNKVTITMDGEVVLEDTDSRYVCTNNPYQIILYNTGDYVLDNYKITTADGSRVICDYTLDTDDEAFEKSDFKLGIMPQSFKLVEGKCKNAPESDSLYDCLMKPAVNAEGKNGYRYG